MTTEDAIRSELVGLLRYANKTAIGEALGVSAQTVINWSEGKYPSQRRLDQVRVLYGLPVTSSGQSEKPPPEDWARAIAAEAAEDVVRRLVPPELLGAAHRLLAQLAEPPPPDGEDAHAELGSRDLGE